MSHDYDPAWDYPVVELDQMLGVSSEDRSRVRQAVESIRTSLAPKMDFAEIEVFFVERMGLTSAHDMNTGRSTVALYCNGTCSCPVLGLDVALMAEVCAEEDEDLARQVELSIAHELAHAYQESIGLDHEHEEGFNEDDAEAFARAWVGRGEIQLDRLKRSSGADQIQRSADLPRARSAAP